MAPLVTQIRELLRLFFAQQWLDDLVEASGQDVGELIKREIDAVIREPSLGKVVGTNAL